jgi:hypothetical protein
MVRDGIEVAEFLIAHLRKIESPSGWALVGIRRSVGRRRW